MQSSKEGRDAHEVARILARIGGYQSVQRFVSKYGKMTTRKTYLTFVNPCLDWLRERGVTLDPDELARDNLRCIYDSSAVDVEMKRRHTDLLNDYVNRRMVEKGDSEATRRGAAVAIRAFYRRNDSELFGDFDVSRENAVAPPAPLHAEDVRKVLKALPLAQKVPLLLMWQSGCEVNRILRLTWRDVAGLDGSELPLRLEFFGRKRHRRAYHSYLGRDSSEHLRLWREKWRQLAARAPLPEDLVFLGKRGMPMSQENLNHVTKKTAAMLRNQGLIRNGDAESWHSHALRHSFSTECSHAGLKPEVREYFMGHLGGIAWVYQHPELHEQDLLQEYQKLEPFVSLDPAEVTIREEYEGREKVLMREFLGLKRNYEELKGEIRSLRNERPSPQGDA